MAHTARSAEETTELFDSPEELEQKVEKLAKLVRASQHMIVFTGAGISTSCGIPDFRSALDTCLDTGPGTWALAAAKQKRTAKMTGTLQAIPSATHMSLVQLQRVGILQHVVSQNTDGLHRRSGLPPGAISELHGNSNLEYCIDCSKEYMRDFKTRGKDPAVRGGQGALFHLTGRTCSCGGKLRDSIVNFTESLPSHTLATAERNGAKADLCLVLGSSCTVTPAANVPPRAKQMVIVNLQPTPLDKKSNTAMRINAKTDDVMQLLMTKLAQKIPRFILERRIKVTVSQQIQTTQQQPITASISAAAGSISAGVNTSDAEPSDDPTLSTTCVSTITIAGVDTDTGDSNTDVESATPYELFRRVNVQVPETVVQCGSAAASASSADTSADASSARSSVTEAPSDSSIASVTSLDGTSIVPNKRGRYRIDTDPAALQVTHRLMANEPQQAREDQQTADCKGKGKDSENRGILSNIYSSISTSFARAAKPNQGPSAPPPPAFSFLEPLRVRVMFNDRYGENTVPLDLAMDMDIPTETRTTHRLFVCRYDVQQPHWEWRQVGDGRS